MENEKLLQLWESFTDISIDDEECIDENFYIWKKGADRFDIWHWFDERFPNGIYEMLYNRKLGKK